LQFRSWGRRFVPVLEALEGRACPSSLSLSAATSSAGNKAISLSGQLSDPNPGGYTIQFSGVYSGSAVTASDGTFSVESTATGLGTIQASVTVSGGIDGPQTVTAQATLTDPGITITNFQAVNSGGGNYTFSALVNAQVLTGLPVSFSSTISAVEGGTSTVQSSGYFYLTVTLAPGTHGDVEAIVTDCWGVQATTEISVTVPS
jgi:hypothetical protein